MSRNPTNRAIQAQNTKKRIYDAAIELIAQKGFDDVKVSEICKKAGVSAGLFYNYFPSKDALTLEQSSMIGDMYARIRDEFRPDETATERFCALARKCVMYKDETMRVAAPINYIYALKTPDKSYMSDESRNTYQIIQEIVEYGRGRKEIPEDMEKDLLVRAVYDLIMGAFFRCHTTHNDYHILQRSLEAEMRLLCEGLCRAG